MYNVKDEWMLKLTALDPNSGHVFDFCIATKKEFNREFVKNFLKPIIDEFKIDTVVTDGAKMYPSIMKELNVKHKLCNFHKMQGLMRRILGKIISFNNKIRNLEVKLEENEKRIDEIKRLRKNKIGRPPKEEQALVDERHNLERENRENRSKIREFKKELEFYIDIKDAVSLMLNSKAKQTGLNRMIK